MNKYIISVIVPIYNGEKYLKDCIDSIINQSFKEFEIVLVDDGSTDSSSKILDEYATLYSNIHVYHKSNEGANLTRKYGVNVAKGEWIVFVDCDDTMPSNALQSLWNEHDNTDVVVGFLDNPKFNKVLTLQECRKESIMPHFFPPSPWAKLYRRSLLTDDIFNIPQLINIGEDMIMNIRVMFRITRPPHFVFKKVYNYRRNTTSVSHIQLSSLEYEETFDKIRELSIPKEEIDSYMDVIIASRLNGLSKSAFCEPHVLCDKKHPYMQTLYNDINKYSYKLNIQEWLLLSIPFAWLYKIFAYLVMVKNFTKYHLGLND